MSTSLQVKEPARSTSVAGDWDVIVVGGGIAGVSAALAAVRRYGKVALVEKECGLGGLATLANVIMYLPLCDGRGRQVMAGMTEELLRLAALDLKTSRYEQGLSVIPDCWLDSRSAVNPTLLQQRREKRFTCNYNPHSFILSLEELLLREGVELFYDTRFVGCLKKNNRLSHVLVENKSGRLALAAAAFIDCSGDADLCAAADCATDDLDGNVACGWHYILHNGKLLLQTCSRHYDKQFATAKGEGPFFSGIHGADVSAQIIETRKDIRKQLLKLQVDNPGDEIFPVMLPSIPSFRATRRLAGDFTLQDGHRHTWFADTIGLTGDWRKSGPVWALPLGALRTQRCPNLYAAGRCLSADRTVWDVTRVIPTCGLSGEAAGAAAMHAIKNADGDSGKISATALQEDLKQHGNLIDPELVAELSI